MPSMGHADQTVDGNMLESLDDLLPKGLSAQEVCEEVGFYEPRITWESRRRLPHHGMHGHAFPCRTSLRLLSFESSSSGHARPKSQSGGSLASMSPSAPRPPRKSPGPTTLSRGTWGEPGWRSIWPHMSSKGSLEKRACRWGNSGLDRCMGTRSYHLWSNGRDLFKCWIEDEWSRLQIMLPIASSHCRIRSQ